MLVPAQILAVDKLHIAAITLYGWIHLKHGQNNGSSCTFIDFCKFAALLCPTNYRVVGFSLAQTQSDAVIAGDSKSFAKAAKLFNSALKRCEEKLDFLVRFKRSRFRDTAEAQALNLTAIRMQQLCLVALLGFRASSFA